MATSRITVRPRKAGSATSVPAAAKAPASKPAAAKKSAPVVKKAAASKAPAVKQAVAPRPAAKSATGSARPATAAKAAESKAPARRAASAGAAVKKAAAKKAAPKKVAAKQVATKQAAPRKVAAKKVAPKKTVAPREAAAARSPAGTPQPRPRRKTEPDAAARLQAVVRNALEDLKARDITEIDVRGKSSVTDLMVIVSGTSSRHVKSIADEVVKKAKQAGLPPIGVEGQREAEWVLVDLGDIVVHVMLPRMREFYALERLWGVGDPEDSEAGSGVLAG